MIGLISLISLIAIIMGGVFSQISTQNEKLITDETENAIRKARKTHTIGLLITLSGTILDFLVVLDEKLADRSFYSPIFHTDYHNVWTLSFIFIYIGASLGSIVLLIQIIKGIRIKNIILETIDIHKKLERREMETKKEMEETNATEEQNILSLIGEYDKVIFVDSNCDTGYKGWKNAFYVNIKREMVMINGVLIVFSDILDCTYLDDSYIVTNQTAVSSSNTDNGNMIGRAIIGGAIAGGVGAVIGGNTAKQNTTTSIQTESKTIHNYIVNITTNNIINPTYSIHCGQNKEAATDIVATINAIISRVRKK